MKATPIRPDRSFRYVFLADSSARLQERPSDPAAAWDFPWIVDGASLGVMVRDKIDASLGFPQHVGLEIQVNIYAGSLEIGLEQARKMASVHLTMISVIGRAPIGAPALVLAYETTPGKDAREFKQQHSMSLPAGKTAVSAVACAAYFDGAFNTERDPGSQFRLVMASELYAAALRQIEPVLRFMLLWPACEAMDDSLRRKLSRKQKDRHWGLKALAESRGEGAELVDTAYQLRNDIFHVRGGNDADALVRRAEDIGNRLEQIMTPGILLLLDADPTNLPLPAQFTTTHAVQLEIEASVHGDVDSWNADQHPHFEFEDQVNFVKTNEDGSLSFDLPGSGTVRGCQSMTLHSMAVRGPHGPNVAKLKMDDALRVVPASSPEWRRPG